MSRTVVAIAVLGLVAGCSGSLHRRVPTITAHNHPGDNSNSVDSKTLAALKAHNARSGALSHEILAVGDSVMLGVEQSLYYYIPGIFIDAKATRQFWDASAVLRQYKSAGLLPLTVVVDIGTNGAFSNAQFAQMMAVLGDRTVYFINLRGPQTWENEAHARLAASVKKYPNAHLIDWHNFAGPHANWFMSDGIHLTSAGAEGYALLVRSNLIRARTPPPPTTTTLLAPIGTPPTTKAPTTSNAPTTTATTSPRTVVRIIPDVPPTLGTNNNEVVRLRATAVLANGTSILVQVTWSVSDPTIAPIFSDGAFGPPRKSGTVTVTATYRPSGGGPVISGSSRVRVIGPMPCSRTTVSSPYSSTTAVATC